MLDVTRRRRSLDIWPGFVDALGALLLVVIFVVLVFTLGHFALSEVLYGRERALEKLTAQVAELADLLSLEKSETARLRGEVGEISASLERTERERSKASTELTDTLAELGRTRDELTAANAKAAHLAGDIRRLEELRDELEKEVASLSSSLDQSRREATAQVEISSKALAQVELLNRQIGALREQLSEISAALELAQGQVTERDAKIEELGRKLNVALASKVQELARYRSDFFGRLRQALGNHPDIRVVGDRFVLQSELLFASGSAELGVNGRHQVRKLVRTLNEIARKIPADIDWVLRIDGHTDRRPINTLLYPSNWELSTARAVEIVRYMIALGVSPNRLAATGFGEFHPLDPRDDPSAYAINRRIEIKLTSR